jgi:hypothetical protein
MITASGSDADVAETMALEKHEVFFRKNVAIKSPHASLVIKRKLIIKAKQARLMAGDPHGNIDYVAGSVNIVAIPTKKI